MNQGRIFTWKLLNTERGRIFPGVEGVFIDVTNDSLQKVTRYCTMFHWHHENRQGFDPRVNVVNFISNFMTKTIPPDSNLPMDVHIFGRFNFPPNEEFLSMLRAKHDNLHLVKLEVPDIFVLTTDPSTFHKVSSDPHEIFTFITKLK